MQLFAGSLGRMNVNRFDCGLDAFGKVCVDPAGSTTVGGGFWPKGTPGQYVFNSGLQVAGIIGTASALIDGRIRMKGGHRSGTPCSAPKRALIGGRNPWSADARGAWILGWSWEQVTHLRATRHLFSDEGGSTEGIG